MKKNTRRSFLKDSAALPLTGSVFAGLINTPGVANANTSSGYGTTQPVTSQPVTTMAAKKKYKVKKHHTPKGSKGTLVQLKAKADSVTEDVTYETTETLEVGDLVRGGGAWSLSAPQEALDDNGYIYEVVEVL